MAVQSLPSHAGFGVSPNGRGFNFDGCDSRSAPRLFSSVAIFVRSCKTSGCVIVFVSLSQRLWWQSKDVNVYQKTNRRNPTDEEDQTPLET